MLLALSFVSVKVSTVTCSNNYKVKVLFVPVWMAKSLILIHHQNSTKEKHTIEVVVDRFKVREDLGNRIAESFETALRLGGDIAVLSWMNGEHADRVFLQSTRVLNVIALSQSLSHVCFHLTTHLVPALFVMV